MPRIKSNIHHLKIQTFDSLRDYHIDMVWSCKCKYNSRIKDELQLISWLIHLVPHNKTKQTMIVPYSNTTTNLMITCKQH